MSDDNAEVVEEEWQDDEVAEAEERSQVLDDSDTDDAVAIKSYDITSFGADYDVEGWVKRLERGDVFIPGFQRAYVWTLKEASRFVESLLLGLPVPGVFLAKEAGSNKLLTIDGQQRLRTLQFFFNGVFNPKATDRTQRVFKLIKVQPQFEGRTYKTLEENDRIKLNDSILHATIVKQESPAGEDTSIYYIFQRLNDGGRKLAPQEIRAAIFHGKLMNEVKEMNKNIEWRTVYGKPSPRLKDQELILRFLAFLTEPNEYKRPMAEFINQFTTKHRNEPNSVLSSWSSLFANTVKTILAAVGTSALRPERAINAAVFDSVMVGMARRLSRGTITNLSEVKMSYDSLFSNKDYVQTVSRSTADEKFVEQRIRFATEAFAKIQ